MHKALINKTFPLCSEHFRVTRTLPQGDDFAGVNPSRRGAPRRPDGAQRNAERLCGVSDGNQKSQFASLVDAWAHKSQQRLEAVLFDERNGATFASEYDTNFRFVTT